MTDDVHESTGGHKATSRDTAHVTSQCRQDDWNKIEVLESTSTETMKVEDACGEAEPVKTESSRSEPDPVENTNKTGPKRRCFRNQWLQEWPWLVYRLVTEDVICCHCSAAEEQKLLTFSTRKDPSFISAGFKSWKKATKSFREHEASAQHREAMLTRKTITTENPVTVQLNEHLKRDQEVARKALHVAVTSLMFLARQGLAIRGHCHHGGNFYQLMRLRSADVPEVVSWLRRRDNWLSDTIQNELIEMLAHTLLRDVVSEVRKSPFFSIIADGTTDVDGKEQFSISLRFVSDELAPNEFFVGFYQCPDSTGETLANVILDVLIRLATPLEKLRGHCFDGAANMSGSIKGVQKLLSERQPLSVYVHCSNHALDLALQETAREVPIVRNTLQTVRDAANIIRESSKRQQLFESLAAAVNSDSGKPSRLQTLCPTRWTVRCKAIDALCKAYSSTLETFSRLRNDRSVRADSRSKIDGVFRALSTMETYLGLLICSSIFAPCEELAINLQSKTMTLSAAVTGARLLRQTLLAMRTEEKFLEMYATAERAMEEMQLDEPTMERRRQPPLRYEHTTTPETAHVFATHQDKVLKMYFEALDMLHSAVNTRFSHPRMESLLMVEKLLLSSANRKMDEAALEVVLSVYGYDFHSNGARWKAQLLMLPQLLAADDDQIQIKSTSDLIASYQKMSKDNLSLFGEITKLMKLLLVCPASVASAERSFSDLRRLKTWLRSSISQPRLTHLALLHCHQERLDSNAEQIINTVLSDFVSKTSERQLTFGVANLL